MAEDFRVTIDFPDHRKTRRLIKKAGMEAILSLLRLWGYAAQYRPKGILTGLTEHDIEAEAGWTGEPGLFFATCISDDIRFIEVWRKGVYRLHDWSEHQPYIYRRPERKKAAQTAASIRWAKQRKKLGDAKGMQTAMRKTQKGNAPLPAPSPAPLPAPSPAPSPVPNNITAEKKSPPIVSTTNSDHKKAFEYFDQKYQQSPKNKLHVKYQFIPGKDGKHIKSLLTTFGFPFYCRLVDQLYLTDDEFIRNQAKVSVGVLYSCANKLAQEIMAEPDFKDAFSAKERKALQQIAQGLGLKDG